MYKTVYKGERMKCGVRSREEGNGRVPMGKREWRGSESREDEGTFTLDSIGKGRRRRRRKKKDEKS